MNGLGHPRTIEAEGGSHASVQGGGGGIQSPHLCNIQHSCPNKVMSLERWSIQRCPTTFMSEFGAVTFKIFCKFRTKKLQLPPLLIYNDSD